MKFFSGKQKGFTLIELMVVIAIIGILASILIVSLRQASDRSKNAKIVTDIVQIRKIAVRMYAEELIGYVNLCGEDSSNLNSEDYPDLGTLQRDIEGFNSVITCYADKDSYCISASFMADDQYFCIDDEGSSIEVTGNPCLSAENTCQ